MQRYLSEEIGGVVDVSNPNQPIVVKPLVLNLSWTHTDATPGNLRGFRIVIFSGNDPNDTSQYFVPPIEVGPNERSVKKAVMLPGIFTVNAAVQALYLNGDESAWRLLSGGTMLDPDTMALATSVQVGDASAAAAAAQSTANSALTLANDAADQAMYATGLADTAQDAADAAQANAASALASIADMVADGKLTPVEKQAERLRWEAVLGERAGIQVQATTFNVNKDAYDSAFQSLANYLNAGSVWASGAPSWLADANLTTTTNIVGSAYRANWKALYDARQALLNAIADKARTNAAAAQTTANAAMDAIDNIGDDGILARGEKPRIITEYRGVLDDYQILSTRASAAGISYTDYAAAYTALSGYMSTLSPAYDNTTADTQLPDPPAGSPAEHDTPGEWWQKHWRDYWKAYTNLIAKLAGAPPSTVKGVLATNVADLNNLSTTAPTIDGVVRAVGDTILLTGQSTPSQDDLYSLGRQVSTGGAAGNFAPTTYSEEGTGTLTNPANVYDMSAGAPVTSTFANLIGNRVKSIILSGFSGTWSSGTLYVNLDTYCDVGEDGSGNVLVEYSLNAGQTYTQHSIFSGGQDGNHVVAIALSGVTPANLRVKITAVTARMLVWDDVLEKNVWMTFAGSADIRAVYFYVPASTTERWYLTKISEVLDGSVWYIEQGSTYGSKTYRADVAGTGDISLTQVSNYGTIASWGSITGNIANQVDLQNAFAAKMPEANSGVGLDCVSFAYNGTHANGYLINTNIAADDWGMYLVEITGFAYGDNCPFHLLINFYLNNNPGYWNISQCKAVLLTDGYAPGTITVSKNASNKITIHLANPVYYMRFYVKAYENGTLLSSLRGWTVVDAASPAWAYAGVVPVVKAITSASIGSQSVNYAASAGNSDTLDGLHLESIVSGNGSTQYGKRTQYVGSFNGLPSGFYDGSSSVGAPTASWYHLINNAHTNSSDGNRYELQIAGEFWDGKLWFRKNIPSGNGTWIEIIHSSNIGTYASAPNHTHDIYSAYDLNVTFTGKPGSYQKVLIHRATRAFRLESSGHQGVCYTNPTTSSEVLTVKKNGTSIGTCTFSTAGTFSTSITQTDFAAGDVLLIENQVSPNSTFADFGITLKAKVL